MESKTVEQQYNEVKVLYVYDSGVDVSEEPFVKEYPDVASALAPYLKDGWSIVSYAAVGSSGTSHNIVLGR